MSVIAFGNSRNGQLGQELNKDLPDPTVIQFLKGKRITHVACGESHSIGISHFGDVYSWGRSKEGQLGTGEEQTKTQYINQPQVIKTLLHERIVKVACGNFHSLALSESGKVYEWGQLHKISTSEKEVGGGNATDMIQMPGLHASYYAEQSLSLYLNGEKFAVDKEVQMVNSNPNQDMDDQEVEENQNEDEQSRHKHIGKIIDHIQQTPQLIAGVLEDEEIIDISAGWAYSAVVTRSGKVFTWGFNEKGQLGLGDRWFHGSPQYVHALKDVKVVSVSCGRQHMCAVTENGLVYSWGLGIFGQLGHGKLKSYLHPVLIKHFVQPTTPQQPAQNPQPPQQNNTEPQQQQEGEEQVHQPQQAQEIVIDYKNPSTIEPVIKIQQITCGANFTVARSQQCKLYSFGHGEYAQLGCITEENQHNDWNRSNGESNHLSYSKPTLIKSLEDKNIKYVACGHLHVLAVTEDNDTYAWGWGSSGCLGFGNKRFYLVPSLVPSLSGEEISSISAGEKHTLVVRSSDTTTFAFDYKVLVNDKETADICFLVQDKKIYGHLFFIKSRCPKLYAMVLFDKRFNSDLYKLNQEGLREIQIPSHIKPAIFLGFLYYMYTDHIIIAPHLRNELAEFALKMSTPRLANLCHQHHYKLRKLEKIPPSTFSKDITNYLEPTEETCDIFFKSTDSDKEFLGAHKSVLLHRNPYFKTMFECSFKESTQSHFILGEDINIKDFKLILDYIYGADQSMVNQENAIDLLCLADRFMIDDLKHVCEYYLEQLIYNNITTLKDYISVKKLNQSIQNQKKTTPNHIKGFLTSVLKKFVNTPESPTTATSPTMNEDSDFETAINSFDNICLLMDVADRFLAKRLQRVCLETFTEIPIQTLSKFIVV
ncbi:regulator of chromosome condensation domain-containing protein [Tieghemostelium lacteum]|uniref:Regulator of chromosome condensation domain-containing protein n=1 Tax=Tieghemostelium lacteum TaxID=361077 RepID=A0A152A077_TIELA|nr:regulator of chromosome condensation domain-containing protein [Tieghemostelium lacteum]|eukprot:KYQ99647.1 regulator of chromosome condensation domain-containing protein [Tieghemostelium lacteum]